MVFDISVYDAAGKEIKYTPDEKWSGPITCNIFNGASREEAGRVDGLWNYILNGVSVLSLAADAQGADYSSGEGAAVVEMKDNTRIRKIVIRSVRFSGYAGYDVPEETDRSEVEEDTTKPEDIDVTEFYDTMVTSSLMDTGNNARIKATIEKARNGEDVTLAYIGGSITEGEGASPNSNCYAEG